MYLCTSFGCSTPDHLKEKFVSNQTEREREREFVGFSAIFH